MDLFVVLFPIFVLCGCGAMRSLLSTEAPDILSLAALLMFLGFLMILCAVVS